MQVLKTRALALVAVLATAACSGSTGPQGAAGQDGTDGTSGTSGAAGATGSAGSQGPAGSNAQVSAVEQCLICHGANALAPIAAAHGQQTIRGGGLNVAVQSVTGLGGAADPIKVTVKLTDDAGNGVDVLGVYSQNTTIAPRLALASISADANGKVQPYAVLTGTATSPSTVTAVITGATKDFVDDGTKTGTYTYTFPATIAYADTAKTHTLWIQATRQMDVDNTSNAQTFKAVNAEYNFVPIGGALPIAKREIVKTDNCNNCHRGFKPDGAFAGTFHGGGRVEGPFCNVCHNPARTNKAANSAVFVHRIHYGKHLQPGNAFHSIDEVTYPQDIRNCNACHAGAAQGDQWKTNPTRAACASCHDYVDFDASTKPICTDPAAKDANGLNVPCSHVGREQPTDDFCASCHDQARIATKHLTVAPPDPDNCYSRGGASGCNNNTNAAYLAAAGAVPPGAAEITYDLKSVSRDASKHPVMVFKLKKDGADVVFNDKATKTELIDNFVGSPSAYFAFAVPQDGIAAPADFNASASGYLKNIWNGKATGTGAGTLTGPDATGYYTVTMTGVTVPDSAKMLTGGLGYTYSLSSTQPLTQTGLAAYPYDTTTKVGGLIVPAADVWKTADGYTKRRDIVDTAKCQTCHVRLGATPTFHAGQRNDGPTCSFCHTPNRTSSGWSANSKDFIHALHAAGKREVPFTWHAVSASENFSEVTFPGPLNDCMACHKAGTYDFSASASSAAVPNLLWSTVASGKFDGTDATKNFAFSPFITADNSDYGAVFSFNVGSTVSSAAAPTTLVTSPVMAACVACHDDSASKAHMKQNGGSFYAPRSVMP